jgi:hypothetical protein
MPLATVFDSAQRDLREQLAGAIEAAEEREERFTHDLSALHGQLMDTEKRWHAGMAQVTTALALGVTNLSCARKTRISENGQRQELVRQLALTRLKLEAQLHRHIHEREEFERDSFAFELVSRESDHHVVGIPSENLPEHEMIIHELMMIELAMNEGVCHAEIEAASAELAREKKRLAQSLLAIQKAPAQAPSPPKKGTSDDTDS